MNWLNRERVNNYPWIFIICYVLVWGYWIASAYLQGHGIDRGGSPIGGDFVQYWAASSLCMEGTPGRFITLPN